MPLGQFPFKISVRLLTMGRLVVVEVVTIWAEVVGRVVVEVGRVVDVDRVVVVGRRVVVLGNFW